MRQPFSRFFKPQQAPLQWVISQVNECFLPTPNCYTEYDIGNKNLKLPQGTVSVKMKKVKDTAGNSFYVANSNAKLW